MKPRAHQHGIAALMTAIVLLGLMSLIAITLNRSGVMEHRMAASTQRSLEAAAAVEGGLSWFSAWLAENSLTEGNWSGSGTQTYSGPPTPPSVSYASGHSYSPVLTLTRASSDTARFKATASVSATDAAASLSAWFYKSAFMPDFSQSAPMFSNGCLTGVTGNPDAWPNNVGGTQVSYASTQTGCVDTGHLDLHGGTVASVTLPSATGDADIWEFYMGNQSLASFIAQASTSPAAGSRYYSLNGNSNWGGVTYGSASAPAILVFHTGCGGKPTGNTTIYGLVLYLTSSSCEINGWNNFTLYGSLAFNGNVSKLNSNVELYGWSQPGGGGSGGGGASSASGPLPGSWKDF